MGIIAGIEVAEGFQEPAVMHAEVLYAGGCSFLGPYMNEQLHVYHWFFNDSKPAKGLLLPFETIVLATIVSGIGRQNDSDSPASIIDP